jgi:hypothetical protein
MPPEPGTDRAMDGKTTVLVPRPGCWWQSCLHSSVQAPSSVVHVNDVLPIVGSASIRGGKCHEAPTAEDADERSAPNERL